MPGGAALLPPDDALRAALVDVIADLEHEWRRERERIEAQAGLVIAELRAEVAALSAERVAIRVAIDEAVAARLATVKDGEPGRSVTIEDVAPMIRSEMDRAVAAMPKPEAPKPAAIDPDEMLRIVRDEVTGAVDALYPREMFDAAQPEAIAAAIRAAVDALPTPRDGRDIDPAEVAAMVQGEVQRAVAAIPPPEPGESVTIDDVAPVIAAEVERAVAALPPPAPGKDADPVEIKRMVDEAVGAIRLPEGVDSVAVRMMVDEAVAALPPAPAGKDADPETVRAMVETAVAALPPPESGRPGEPGAPGKLPVVREWADGVHYEADVVTHAGAVYQAQRDTGREPPHEDWLLIVKAGRDGADGRSFRVRETWSAVDTYRCLDVVALNGASFVARRDDPGPCPGDGWQIVAMQGKAGKPPEPSVVRDAVRAAVAALPPAKKGDPGPPVVAMDVDAEGMLTLTNADGSVVTCDLYPVLAKVAQ